VKALITAAGLGSRLGSITKDINKCLLPVGGKPLMRHSVDSFKELGISDIIVVTGYHADKVMQEFGNEVTYVYNKDYATTTI
jgi:NDP-sugar pyrophosphorylase family protein